MKECTITINKHGLTVEAGTLRIQNLDDILLKQSATDVGESLKAYMLSKIEGEPTIETSNVAKVIEENQDTIQKLENEI